jgi:adenosylcobinamide-phosphate synthase
MSEAWAGALAVAVAMAIDHRWGEPPTWAHPVVAMGRYLGALGPALTRLPPVLAFMGGMLAWMLGAFAVAWVAASLAQALTLGMSLSQTWMPDGASAWTTALHAVGLGALLKPLLSWRMLRDEVSAVEQALGRSLQDGRQRLRHLVSRDVDQLGESAVRESAIESLAENLNDALVAPLFWFAIGGLPAAAIYRFANTADAMWGYRGRYEWAGKWAAHIDDVLSWVPARLTALLLCLAARTWPGWQAMLGEARRTPSPNGGWPMGTMALLLGACLRKPGAYALNEAAREPQARDTAEALRWSARAAWMAAAACGLLLTLGSLCLKAPSARWPT